MSVGVVEGEEFKTMLCDSVAFLTYFLFSLLLLLLPTYLLTYLFGCPGHARTTTAPAGSSLIT